MKRILITGENSYIGSSVEKWLLKSNEKYSVDTINLRDTFWKETDFSNYDVVFHVAGIAHVSTNKNLKDLYFQVNRDLTIDIATKAKNQGVNQFIFMSSIIVYGSEATYIDLNTVPNPDSFYGESKLLAEKGIKHLESDNFNIAIIRPPMIYGKGSKGNYKKLSKLAKRVPIFPNYENQRSMLYIDNLCEFIRLIIDKNESGIFYPQNREYVTTTDLAKQIADFSNSRIVLIKMFNPFIRILITFPTFNKLFGTLVYDKEISVYPNMDYQIVSFEESIRLTEYEK